MVDIEGTEWYSDDLAKLIGLNIVKGSLAYRGDIPVWEFRGEETLNHAQLYSLVSSIAERKVTVLNISPTSKLGNKWYSVSTENLQALGFIKDNLTEEDLFKDVTRLEAVELLTKVAEAEGVKGIDISTKFKDTKEIKAPMLDIVQGYGDGTYGKDDILTRAQAVAMIARTLELMGK